MTSTLPPSAVDFPPPPGPRRTGASGPLRPAPPDPARVGAVAAKSLLALALVTAWALSYVVFFSRFEESRAQHGLYEKFRTQLASLTAPLAQPIPRGAPVATLSLPSLKVRDLIVVEGTASSQLKDGPGHLPNSVLPGQVGTSVIYGKSLTYGGPFGDLTKVQRGAVVEISTGQGTFRYRIDRQRHRGDPEPVVAAGSSHLTLVTAVGSGLFGSFTPNTVLYVDATLAGPPVDRGAVGTPAAADAPLAVDDSVVSLYQLILTLQLVVVLLLGTVWARSRWPFPQVWAAAVPAIAAATWLCAGMAANFLPNVF